ncbi:sensor histidine kinase [Williamwhitmania taraxaci]|uniref:Histidine kinase n=1 Tax=Williamwhitmania taraxaci TaxID=1640674 RepID=A0A1G6KJG4_9BACT|nr:histidine kinase [Williamwhitmania taraxaci]SDC30941.1 Histidine kinase [Williamwhitmania taraxaci]
MKNDLNNKLYWTLQLVAWTTYSAFNAIIGVFVYKSKPLFALTTLIAGAFMLLLSHIYRDIIKRYKWVSLPIYKTVGRVLLSIFLIAAIGQLMNFALMVLFKIYRIEEFSIPILAISVVQMSIVMMLWSLIYFSIHYVQRYKAEEINRWRMEALLKEAELATLKAQINPHFIFNCLNNIRSLVVEDQEKARTGITQLSDMLRYSFQHSQVEKVLLEKEVEVVKSFLQLESIHLEERLAHSLSVQPETLGYPIPPMVIQLLVENAIKHGISKLPKGGYINIDIKERSGIIIIEVENSGQLKENKTPGIGLKNLRDRLRISYSDAASFTLVNKDETCVLATVKIPAQQ